MDRLERAGYVRREPHPTDRRSVIVKPQHLKEVQQRVGPIFQNGCNVRVGDKQEVDRKSSQQNAANSDLLLILIHPQATIAGLQDFTLLY